MLCYLNGENLRCGEFPDGIPASFWRGEAPKIDGGTCRCFFAQVKGVRFRPMVVNSDRLPFWFLDTMATISLGETVNFRDIFNSSLDITSLRRREQDWYGEHEGRKYD